MKLFNFFSHASTRNALATIIAAILGAPALSAQQSFQVVPDHSIASLYLGSRDNPTSSNVGIARVSGQAQLKSDDPSASHFDFTIYAAGQNPSAANSQTASGDQPVITFESKSVKARNDGTFQVRGKLTVTQVERTLTAGTGEDYSGPVYGPARLVRTTHEATFVLAAAQTESSPDTTSGNVQLLTVQREQPESLLVISAATTVTGEAFPELSHSVQNAVWPIPINNEQCSAPSSTGEDYSGVTCSGQAIEPAPSAVVPAQTGEDYAGVQVVPPAGDDVTIQLKLVLASTEQHSSGNTNGTLQQPAGAR